MYIYVQLNLFAIQQKLTHHCKYLISYKNNRLYFFRAVFGLQKIEQEVRGESSHAPLPTTPSAPLTNILD